MLAKSGDSSGWGLGWSGESSKQVPPSRKDTFSKIIDTFLSKQKPSNFSYTETECIGSGKYGKVCKGTFTSDELGSKNAAIKTIKIPLDELDEHRLKRMLREISILKKLKINAGSCKGDKDTVACYYGSKVRLTDDDLIIIIVSELMD